MFLRRNWPFSPLFFTLHTTCRTIWSSRVWNSYPKKENIIAEDIIAEDFIAELRAVEKHTLRTWENSFIRQLNCPLWTHLWNCLKKTKFLKPDRTGYNSCPVSSISRNFLKKTDTTISREFRTLIYLRFDGIFCGREWTHSNQIRTWSRRSLPFGSFCWVHME